MTKVEILTRFAPLAFNLLLVIWTISVSPGSAYGDNWAIYPALVVFPLIIIWHIVLIFIEKNKLTFILYGLLHSALSFYIWMVCLMKISKDSL